MLRQIVSRFHPEKIILFGPHARGDAGLGSDVDLLVVIPFFGSKLEKQLALRNILFRRTSWSRRPRNFIGERRSPDHRAAGSVGGDLVCPTVRS
jgi:predicted nucleotidyltransferase